MTESINLQIGKRLKALRVNAKLSQAALAKLCGWSGASRVANYEYGIRCVGANDAVELARTLNTTPEFIIFGRLEPRPDSEQKLLSLFRQLPLDKQEEVISFIQSSLIDLDEYVERYIKGRSKSPIE